MNRYVFCVYSFVSSSILLLSTQQIMELISTDMLGSRDGQGSVSFSHSVSRGGVEWFRLQGEVVQGVG